LKRVTPKIQFLNLSIENFGPYKGVHNIQFSINPKMNLTLLKGDQGSGKTTIFQMIWWLLFPKFKEIDKENELIFLRSHGIKEAVNKISIRDAKKNDEIKVGGTIKFNFYDSSGNKTIYEISRYIYFVKTNRSINYKNKSLEKSEKLEITKNYKMVPNPIDIYNTIIRNIFPEEIRDFVFIYGEGLTRILSIENVGKIKNYALGISDYSRIKGLIKYLDECEKYFKNKRKKANKENKKLKDILEEIEKLEEEKNKKTIELKEKESLLKETIDKVANLKEEIRRIPGKIDFIRSYNEYITREKELKKRKNEIIEFREQKLMEYLPFIYLEKEMINVLQDIQIKQEQGIIPGKLNKEILKSILERENSCICGTKWTSDMRERLEDMISKSPDEKYGTNASKFGTKLDIKLNDIRKAKKEIFRYEKKLIEINEKIREIESKKQDLSLRLSDEERNQDWYKKIQELETKISVGDQSIGKLEAYIENVEENLQKLEDEIDTKEKTYRREKEKNSKSKSETIFTQYIDKIKILKEMVKEMESMIAEQIRKRTQIETLKTLQKIAKGENWEKIDIEDQGTGWKIYAINKNQSEIINISTGQTNVLGLSFIFALSNVIGIDLPLIIDSPFVNLDLNTREKIMNNLPEIYEGRQLIFFVKDSELIGPKKSDGNHKDLLLILEKCIGKKYEIVNPEEDNAQLKSV